MWYNTRVSENSKFYISADYAFQDQASVYLFTNENVAGYLNKLCNLNGGRVLTVASSGDHGFEARLLGATHIDSFDINSYQRNVLELKTRMIRALPYSDFMDFFFDKRNFFNPKIIAPIASQFSRELKYFMNKCDDGGAMHMFKYRGPTAPEYDLRHISYINSAEDYERLRDILPEKINFHHCKLERVSAKFQRRYDLIMLSNIFYYMYTRERTNEDRFAKFYHNILRPLAENNLADGGKICFNYMWNTNPSVWSNFVDFIQMQYVKDRAYSFISRSVISAFHDTDWDTALIMQKRQR